MGRRDGYRTRLRALGRADRPGFLRHHSGLPGPRANLELVEAAADVLTPAEVDDLLATGEEYLVVCGAVGLGAQLAASEPADPEPGVGAHPAADRGAVTARLRVLAGDGRWRVREGVAMALQRLGDASTERLFQLARAWAGDPDPLVQRAAVAGVCEPRLLRAPAAAGAAVEICECVTASLAARPAGERRRADVRTLRQALGYAWSVAVAADPAAGLPRFVALDGHPDGDGVPDRDVVWIIRENRRKARLARLLDPSAG